MRTSALLLSLAILIPALSSPAQSQSLAVGIGSNQAVYYPGDRLELTVAVSGSGQNGRVDFFSGLILPDGATVVTVGLNGAPHFDSLGALSTLVPLAADVALNGPFAASVDPLFAYALSGVEPLGSYTIFLAATRSGAFADNRLDAGDLLAISTGTLNIRRPAQFIVDQTRVASSLISSAGGLVQVATGGAQRATLDLPANAVLNPTTISAAPITAAPGLPVHRLVGALRFGPSGLQLRTPARLSFDLPPGVPAAGLVGFVAKDDGTGFEFVPVTISGRTASIRVGHFSVGGVASDQCGSGVTSAVGIAACRRLDQKMIEAGRMVADLQSFPLPVRLLLASEILAELRPWLNQFILPSLADAANPAKTDPTVHYFFLVAFGELQAIKAILQMTEMLDPSAGLASELSQADTLVPAGITVRRANANAQCLADKSTLRAQITRVLDLAAVSQTLNLPFDTDANGVTCVLPDVTVTYPTVVPQNGATFTGVVTARFSDGVAVTDPLVVSIEVENPGVSRFGAGTLAQGVRTATLSTTVTPSQSTPDPVVFDVVAKLPQLGITRRLTVRRTHRIIITASDVTARRAMRAGSNALNESFSFTKSVFLNPATLTTSGPAGDSTLSDARAGIDATADATTIFGDGHLAHGASGDADSNVFLTTSAAVTLTDDFDCTFSVTTTEFNLGATPSFSFRVDRNGVTLFQTAASRTSTQVCPAGTYQLLVDVSSTIHGQTGLDSTAARTYRFSATATPK